MTGACFLDQGLTPIPILSAGAAIRRSFITPGQPGISAPVNINKKWLTSITRSIGTRVISSKGDSETGWKIMLIGRWVVSVIGERLYRSGNAKAATIKYASVPSRNSPIFQEGTWINLTFIDHMWMGSTFIARSAEG